MTGWNLPPGCNVSDLPGNTPADQASETMYDAIYEALKKFSDEPSDELVEAIAYLMGQAWCDGYSQGHEFALLARAQLWKDAP